jgi:photosystem II stability/assembly factor-like uncharacterized protein
MKRLLFITLALTAALGFYWLLGLRRSPRPFESQLQVSGARRALDLLSDIRSYPNANIPETGFFDEFVLSKQTLRKGARSVQRQPWRPIGPNNIGGRTLAIALNPQNPNTVYAGSASGGLWRSFSGGRGATPWEKIRTGFPVLGVSTIAIAPEDSNTIYIGTGEVYGSAETFPGIVGDRTTRGSYGIGILKTADGGQTWTKALDWTLNQRRGVQDVRIDPQNASTIWAATTEGTYKSTDGGVNWNHVLDVVMGTDIAIHPNDPNIVFVACGGMGSPGHGVYRTQDGGDNWVMMDLLGQSFTFRGKAKLAMSQSSPNVVYASVGKSSGALFTGESIASWLFRTNDGGDNWTLVSTEDYARIQGWYSHDIAVNPVNPDEIWAGGQPFSPFLSLAGGADLTAASELGLFVPSSETTQLGLPGSWADFHDIVYHPTNPDIIYFANDGGVFRTLDGGRTVENCSRGYQTTQFYNGTSSSTSDSLFTLGGLQDNNSAAYEGDPTWRRLFAGDGSWTAINQDNNDIIYLSYQFLNMARSADRGFGEFTNITPERNTVTTNFIAPFILSPIDNSTMYAGSDVVFRSNDGGSSWTSTNNGSPLDTNPTIALAGSFQNAEVVYAATSPGQTRGHIFLTENGGETWKDITGNLPDRFPMDLAVDPSGDQIAYVTFGGFGSSHVFVTPNSGDSWVDIGQGLPDVPTWSVIVDPDFSNQIFVGNELGVYVSIDGGNSWEEFTDGLPEVVFAMDLTISPSNRVLRVATHGNGFYETALPLPETRRPIPETITLAQNYPNPFNQGTRIDYYLSEPSSVQLRIYNVMGREVATLVNQDEGRGWHFRNWDGIDRDGQRVASGLYVYRLIAGNEEKSRTMLLLK